MIRLKKFISLCTLLVFLFPVVLNATHQFEHLNDTHCSEKKILHFHETEHHCELCDFVPLLSGSTSFLQEIKACEYLVLSETKSPNSIVFCSASSDATSLRGPPRFK